MPKSRLQSFPSSLWVFVLNNHFKNFEISKWTYMNSDSRQGYRTSEQHRVEPERKCCTLPLATERKYWYLPVKPTYITERWWSISFVSSTDVELPCMSKEQEGGKMEAWKNSLLNLMQRRLLMTANLFV